MGGAGLNTDPVNACVLAACEAMYFMTSVCLLKANWAQLKVLGQTCINYIVKHLTNFTLVSFSTILVFIFVTT